MRYIVSRLAIAACCVAMTQCASVGDTRRTRAIPQSPRQSVGALSVVKGTMDRKPDFILLADAQINENHGAPMFIQSGFAQSRIAVSRRSVQQTTFSDMLLKQTALVASNRGDIPIVFLGDALNLSCESELERYRAVVKNWPGEWLTLPGNHDGFFTGVTLPERNFHNTRGISSPDYGRDRWTWNRDCASHVVRKSTGAEGVTVSVVPEDEKLESQHAKNEASSELKEFATGYVEALVTPPLLNTSVMTRVDLQAGCHQLFGTASRSRQILWCTYMEAAPERPAYKAFILQKVRRSNQTGPVDFIFLDSSVYDEAPCFVGSDVIFLKRCLNAGSAGGLGLEQRRHASALIEESRREGEGVPVLLFAHHPVADWQQADKDWLLEEIRLGGVATIFTAHIHQGCLRKPFDAEPEFREVNVDSVIDSAGRTDQNHSRPSGFAKVWFEVHDGKVMVTYTPIEIDETFLGCTDRRNASLPTSNFDSVEAQVEPKVKGNDGPYYAQLNQARAEGALLNRMQVKGAPASGEIDTISRAYSSIEHCGDWRHKLQSILNKDSTAMCEADTRFASSEPVVGDFVAREERRLAQVDGYIFLQDGSDKSPAHVAGEWERLREDADFRQWAACSTVQTIAPYWTQTGSDRQDVVQCVQR